MSHSSIAVVILAAGRGTRMKARDDAPPKVLARLLGQPLCAFPVGLALALKPARTVIVIGHGGESVEAALRVEFPAASLSFAIQQEQRGTADAVLAARPTLASFSGKILILSGDVPLLTPQTLQRLLSVDAGLVFMTMQRGDPTGYGRVVRGADGLPQRVVEEKDCTPEQRRLTEVNAGIYLVDSDLLWEALSKVEKGNAQGEYYLTDVVALAASRGKARTLLGDADELSGINDRVDLAESERRLRARVNRDHMLAGATLVDPATTYIDLPVRLGRDVRIEPGCVLSGRTEIADGVHIRAYSLLEDSRVGEGCVVGPFARLRPGTVLERNVHVGNFVETKNTSLGEGAKANHVSYLGDTQIGARANIGAGTIVCNYDGVQKNRTVIGEGAFIGSDSQLVAPVEIGAGAFVGAGTTVTEDVPADALALTRVPQTVKPGWAAKRRARLATKNS
jgi:bifunctional UDP-N-acetylglucosamine pyrophosphorylase / glucosamine-1-phosphate N-acetyltransferase